MKKTILLIENDAVFAREITEALETAGFQVRVTGDGKEGLDLAKDASPAAIVLCVELPKMSGYSICNKLKKDEALKSIPLLLASAEATPETFELHRKLKTHAEDYLLKPYTPADLLARLSPLVGLPAPHASTGHAEEEVVSLEEDIGLASLAAEPEVELPSLDLGTLPDEPAPGASGGGGDDDLRLLDDAFEGLSAPEGGGALDLSVETERAVAVDELDAAAASLPEADETAGRAALGDAADDPDLSLGELEGEVSAGLALEALDALAAPEPEDLPGAPASRGARTPSVDLDRELKAAIDLAPEPAAARPSYLGLVRDEPPASAGKAAGPLPVAAGSSAELGRLEADLAERRAAVAARDAEIGDLHDRVDALTRRAEDAESGLADRDAEMAALKARAETLAAQVKRGEADARAGREEARRAADQARAAEDRIRAAEEKVRAAEAQLAAVQEKARATDAQLTAAQEKARATEAQLAAAQEKARATEAQLAAVQEKARAAEAQASAALADVERQRTAHAETRTALDAKVAELAGAAARAARLQEVERDVERLETELIVARGEVEGARSEVEKRGTELKRRIGELEAANVKNEERVVKAYLKIKGDEKVRDKARKALSIALQLLDEGLPHEAPEKRAAGATATKLE